MLKWKGSKNQGKEKAVCFLTPYTFPEGQGWSKGGVGEYFLWVQKLFDPSIIIQPFWC